VRDSEHIVMVLLASVVIANLLVGLIGVAGCMWAQSHCTNVDWRFWFGEPMAALLGLLGGRALERKQ
jgi:hypothetical protein